MASDQPGFTGPLGAETIQNRECPSFLSAVASNKRMGPQMQPLYGVRWSPVEEFHHSGLITVSDGGTLRRYPLKPLEVIRRQHRVK
ncbi:MAG: hypothetical protein JWO80_3834 [Bryobacterales bacterium]|nr:hypothetical protein [Bryobacterales bacterium]